MTNALDNRIANAIRRLNDGMIESAMAWLNEAIAEAIKLGWFQHVSFLRGWHDELWNFNAGLWYDESRG